MTIRDPVVTLRSWVEACVLFHKSHAPHSDAYVKKEK